MIQSLRMDTSSNLNPSLSCCVSPAGKTHPRMAKSRAQYSKPGLIAVMGDEDTVTGFLLAGIGQRDKQTGETNFLVVTPDGGLLESLHPCISHMSCHVLSCPFISFHFIVLPIMILSRNSIRDDRGNFQGIHRAQAEHLDHHGDTDGQFHNFPLLSDVTHSNRVISHPSRSPTFDPPDVWIWNATGRGSHQTTNRQLQSDHTHNS